MGAATIVRQGPVYMLVRALSGGGAQRDAIELANGLLRAGWPMRLVTLDARGPLADRIAPGLPVDDLGRGRALRMAAAGLALRRLLLARAPGVLIASEASGNALAMLVGATLPAAQRPRIVLREVATPSLARQGDPYWQNRLAYRLAPWFYPRADAVVCLTRGVRDELIGEFGVAGERAINLGTNAVLDAAALRQMAKPLERDQKLIVAIGRLSPEKDFTTLIQAVALLPQPVRLRIWGDGPERDGLRRLIGRLDLGHRVTLEGFTAAPLQQLRGARLFVSSSRHEGFGNAIVEALAAGTPVVSTDAPHGPREILAGGRYGMLVPPGDTAALAGAIAKALATPFEPARLQARAADFTTERAAAAFGAVLENLGHVTVDSAEPEHDICSN